MNKKSILIFLGAFIFLVLISVDVMYGQCAMCKAAVESEAENGGSIGAGLNSGILYLMSVPYIMAGAAAIWFYRKYKKNQAAELAA